jgi:parallel beta-helix repeat protein
VAGQASEADIDTALQMAGPGDTVAFGPGTFSFSNTLTLSSAGVTIQGAGKSLTTFDFTGQTAGADGIDVLTGSDHLTLQGFEVLNAAGNAIKVEGSQNVIFEDLAAIWTQVHHPANGPYGIYPVQCINLLIENCLVVGASDSGIYVGQSQNAVVRNNEAHDNVAGIEIENTFHADVYGNNSHDNTAGILVFDLPGLQQQGGHDNRIFDNQIVHNNTQNFAVNGDIVSIIPAGTGFFVMANHDDEVFGNTITGNETAAVAVISYYLSQIPITDPSYYPFPFHNYVHDNYLEGNGDNPIPSPLQPLGILLADALGRGVFPDGRVADLLDDGFYDPAVALDAGVAPYPDAGLPPSVNVMQTCFHANGGDGGAATFADLNAPWLQVYLQLPDGGTNPEYDGGAISNLGAIVSLDPSGFDCTQAPIAGVSLGGLLPDGGP